MSEQKFGFRNASFFFTRGDFCFPWYYENCKQPVRRVLCKDHETMWSETLICTEIAFFGPKVLLTTKFCCQAVVVYK